MRKRSIFLMMVVLLATMLPFAASAKVATAGVPGGPFKTTFRVQNLGAADAICTYDVYNNTGSTPSGFVTTSLPAIKPGAAATVAVDTVANFPTGTNAAVISCSEQVAVNVMFNDATKTDAYNGVANPAMVLWVPQAFKLNGAGYRTSIRVQNASSSANTGKIEYFKGVNKITETAINLAGNGAITLDQKDVAALVSGNAYAAKITMTQPVAAIVSVFGKEGTSKENRLRAYEAFTDGENKTVFAPVLMRNYSASKYDTTINIQNLDDNPATVRVKYVGSGTTFTREYVVQSDATKSVKQDLETTLPNDKVFAAKITPVDPDGAGALPAPKIIVTVDEVSEFYSRDTTYVATADGGTKVAIPYVLRHYKGYNSSVTCQNVSDEGDELISKLTITYYRVKNDGTISETNRVIEPANDLKPGKTLMIYQGDESLLPYNPDTGVGSFASMTVEVTESFGDGIQEISCVANVDQTDGAYRTQQKDRLSGYTGIVVP